LTIQNIKEHSKSKF